MWLHLMMYILIIGFDFLLFSLSSEKIDKRWLGQDVWNRGELKEKDN